MRWQATICPGDISLATGISLKHLSVANSHLLANLQQFLGLIGLEISPLIGIRLFALALSGSASGIEDRRALV
jgi:hypothetical protein